MKKIKSIVIALLSVTCLFAATACEGVQFVTPGTTNSSSTETENSSKPKKTLNEKEWEALSSAIEKSMQAGYNFTLSRKHEQLETGKTNDGKKYRDYTNVTEFSKYTERLEEEKIENSGTDSYSVWRINVFTSELSGVIYEQRGGEWSRSGGFNHSSAADRSRWELMLNAEELEELKNQLEYDKKTGIYSITDCTMDINTELLLGGAIKNGTATQRIDRLELELQDGYIYRYYFKGVLNVNATISYEDGEDDCDFQISSESTLLFTDYGKTTITLPEEIKAEVEELFNE